MTREEAIRKLEYSKKAYQMLIDEKVDSGKLVGKDVKGEWKADTPLDEAYKSMIDALDMAIKALEQDPKIEHCKDCKYFEYDSMAKVDGIPLIVAHEICSRWGDGCKTSEYGYCFLFEPQERSDKE